MGITITPKSKPQATTKTTLSEKGAVVSETEQKESPDLGVEPPKQAEGMPWCQVLFASSYTHNLGNFRSCKVEVGLVMPCRPQEIDKVYGVVEKWVDGKMSAQVEAMTGGDGQ